MSEAAKEGGQRKNLGWLEESHLNEVLSEAFLHINMELSK